MKLKTLQAQALQEAIVDISEPELEFLDSITNVELQREYFISLIYRMPLEELKKLYEGSAAGKKIHNERNKYLVRSASDRDPEIKKATELYEKVDAVLKKNEELKGELAVTLRESRDSCIRERTALEDHIKGLKAQQEEYKHRIRQYEEQVNELKNERLLLKAAQQEVRVSIPPSADAKSLRERIGLFEGRRAKRRKDEAMMECGLFLEKLIASEGLKDDQKDYLIGCLGRGIPVETISRVMKANLTVELMEKFINIYNTKTGEKNV